LADLRPTLATLPPLTDRLRTLLPLVTPVTDCVRDRALPVLESKLDDGKLSTGRPVWQEAVATLPGVAGASGSFDANGAWVRYNSGVGDATVSTGAVPGLSTAVGTLSGTSSSPPIGSRPTWLGSRRTPPFRPDVPCASNQPPDLQARTGGGSPMRSRAGVRKTPTTRAQLERLLAAPDAPVLGKQAAP
ncbi:MAG: hypothetical protein H0V81_02375, partial [Solirubrobacterales bacterium]|nr:hypothetical protein [Solirubrobacterales bacterium]